MIVIDASITVKWFVKEDGHEPALGLLDGRELAAPDLIFSETANVLWKKLRRGEVTAEQARRACRELPGFLPDVVSTATLMEDALGLARQLDHPVYDCTYLACAELRDAKLISADRRFLSKARDHNFGHRVIDLDDTEALAETKTSPGTAPET